MPVSSLSFPPFLVGPQQRVEQQRDDRAQEGQTEFMARFLALFFERY